MKPSELGYEYWIAGANAQRRRIRAKQREALRQLRRRLSGMWNEWLNDIDAATRSAPRKGRAK